MSSILSDLIKRYDLKKGQKVLVGYSAGPDSTFLALQLLECGLQPILVYLNYHDSPTVEKEEKTALAFSSFNELELIKFDVTVKDGGNFEAEARRIRFDFFQEVARKYEIDILFLGHHKNDLVETYLLQKKRGTLVSYYGIKEKNNISGLTVLRPLLTMTKNEIYRYLKENKIDYYEDPTNTNTLRERNRIRPTLSDKDLDLYLDIIEKENRELQTINQTIESLLKERSIPLWDYHRLSEEAKRRLLFAYLKQNLSDLKEKKILSLVNKVFMRLKARRSFEERLDDKNSLYSSKDCFFIAPHLEVENYCYLITSNSLIDDKNIYCNTLMLKDELHFPLRIVPLFKGGRIKTKLEQKDGRGFVRKMGVPIYLLDIYPVLKDQKGDIIYIPYYSDLTKGQGPLRLKSIEFLTSRERRDGRNSL